jgi:hypothetical protein
MLHHGRTAICWELLNFASTRLRCELLDGVSRSYDPWHFFVKHGTMNILPEKASNFEEDTSCDTCEKPAKPVWQKMPEHSQRAVILSQAKQIPELHWSWPGA